MRHTGLEASHLYVSLGFDLKINTEVIVTVVIA